MGQMNRIYTDIQEMISTNCTEDRRRVCNTVRGIPRSCNRLLCNIHFELR